jgi:hypothetical protein
MASSYPGVVIADKRLNTPHNPIIATTVVIYLLASADSLSDLHFYCISTPSSDMCLAVIPFPSYLISYYFFFLFPIFVYDFIVILHPALHFIIAGYGTAHHHIIGVSG